MVRLALRYYVILQILPWQSVFMSAASTHANAVKLGSAGAAAQALSESSQLCFTLTPVTITHGGSTTTLPSSFQNCQSRPGETTPYMYFDLFHIFCHSSAVAFNRLCCTSSSTIARVVRFQYSLHYMYVHYAPSLNSHPNHTLTASALRCV